MITTYPEVDPDSYVSPLEIVSRSWTPGTSGWRIGQDKAEFQKVHTRSPITVAGAGNVNGGLLGLLASGGSSVNMSTTQAMCMFGTFVGAPSGGYIQVNFEQYFINDCWNVVACFGDSPGLSAGYASSWNRFGFRWYSSSAVTSRINYVAVGY